MPAGNPGYHPATLTVPRRCKPAIVRRAALLLPPRQGRSPFQADHTRANPYQPETMKG